MLRRLILYIFIYIFWGAFFIFCIIKGMILLLTKFNICVKLFTFYLTVALCMVVLRFVFTDAFLAPS